MSRIIDNVSKSITWKTFSDWQQFTCPICGFEYVYFFPESINIPGNDNYEANPRVRGNVIKIPFFCENGHEWNLFIGFHKGYSFTWIETDQIDYKDYISSLEWKEKADAAKERVGYRCQLCNHPEGETKLHAHHRTYERLGKELPEDITVLCEDCHRKYHGR